MPEHQTASTALAGGPRALEDRHPDRTLQFQDGAAQRRLLNFESTRGAVEAAVIRRRDGVAKLANIEGHTQLSRALIAP